jgi:hypothetical protein
MISIPYGYLMKNGIIESDPKGSVVVCEIYALYLAGKSYVAIANLLNERGVRRGVDEKAWNKNKIKRILEDSRYTCNDDCTAIVSESDYLEVQGMIARKNTVCRTNAFRPQCSVVCGQCGSAMKRIHHQKWKVNEAWRCANPECRHRVAISDMEFESSLTAIMNILIKNPDIAYPETDRGICHPPDTPETMRVAGEIDNMIGAVDFDKERVKKLIFSLAAEKYKAIDNTGPITGMIRAEFEKADPLFSFNKELFYKTTQIIRFDNSGELFVVLKNGKSIRRRNQDGSINGRANNAEDCACNTA